MVIITSRLRCWDRALRLPIMTVCSSMTTTFSWVTFTSITSGTTARNAARASAKCSFCWSGSLGSRTNTVTLTPRPTAAWSSGRRVRTRDATQADHSQDRALGLGNQMRELLVEREFVVDIGARDMPGEHLRHAHAFRTEVRGFPFRRRDQACCGDAAYLLVAQQCAEMS